MSATATTSSRAGDVTGTLGASIALAGTLDGLVDDLGRRLGLPVRVELRVVAFESDVLVKFRLVVRELTCERRWFEDAYPGGRRGSV